MIAGAVLTRVGAGAVVRSVTFGRNANSVYHAFRHTDELGLDRVAVQSAVLKHFLTVLPQMTPGKSLSFVVTVNGHRLQYTAYAFPDGTFNIGRIHPHAAP